jgi:hypothetical protein
VVLLRKSIPQNHNLKAAAELNVIEKRMRKLNKICHIFKFCFVLHIVFLCASTHAENINDFNFLSERKPILAPEEVVHLAKQYLEKQQKFKVAKFKLVHLSFNYVSWDGKSSTPYEGEWTVAFFDPTADELNNHSINVTVSNSKEPKFYYTPPM